jgi:hypothetical protein
MRGCGRFNLQVVAARILELADADGGNFDAILLSANCNGFHSSSSGANTMYGDCDQQEQ